MNRTEYFARWSRLHGGVAPTGLVGGWLGLSHALARPLARAGVRPDLITLAGPVTAALALLPASAGGRWPLLAVLIVVLAALLDGTDGAVAVISDRVTRRGALLDGICDRISDLCFVAALWLAGAPPGWCVAGGVLTLLHEQVRAGARAAGMRDVGVVTVAERPTRVIIAAAFLLAAGLYPGAVQLWSTAGAITWTAVAIVGLVQLSVVVARRLDGSLD